MANCVKCGTKVEEGIKFCPTCGSAMEGSAQQQNSGPEEEKKDFSSKVSDLNNTKDTTADYDSEDIEKNKVMGLLAYILFLIPLLAAKNSRFARFHTNQGLVLFIVAIISSVIAIIPLIGWIIAAIMSIVVAVLAIIGIINALNGKAKELPVIGKYRILK